MEGKICDRILPVDSSPLQKCSWKAMLSRFAAAMLAVAGSASAFAPMMSMSDMGRREV